MSAGKMACVSSMKIFMKKYAKMTLIDFEVSLQTKIPNGYWKFKKMKRRKWSEKLFLLTKSQLTWKIQKFVALKGFDGCKSFQPVRMAAKSEVS